MTKGRRIDADVAVVGSGFAGSLVALALKRRGRRVVLVERGRHPRFAIGESSTPLANLLLEEIADRYDLPRLRVFSKWGTWQRARPDVAGGLKRGFTFLFHQMGEAFTDDSLHSRQLMVGASPSDEVGDTHWYRADFDHALVREAQTLGVEYIDETELDAFADRGSQIVLSGTRNARPLEITARFVVDATGPRGCLHRLLLLPTSPFRWLPHTHGLYSHFVDVDRWDELEPPHRAAPYRPDDAALHHVFPGGWIWVLRFNNGITSAGAALTDAVASRLPCERPETAWQELLSRLPSVQNQFRQARAVIPFVYTPRLAFRTHEIVGRRWAMLPSAAGVIDPLLSTGFPLTLLGIERLLRVLETTSDGENRSDALQTYARVTLDELDACERLVAALYANMDDVELFKRLSLLYFAAASYSEAVRRLGRPERAPGFLLHAHPQFGPAVDAATAIAIRRPAGAEREELFTHIARAIEPFDTAGLLDETRRSWYPVLSDDLIAGASKLGATIEEIYRLLERCGFGAHQVSSSRAAGPTMNKA